MKAGEVRSASHLAELLLRDVDRIAEGSAARIQELLPSYAGMPRDEIVPVVRVVCRNVLERIREPGADTGRPLDELRAGGEMRARQGIPIDEMLHAWRIGLEDLRDGAHAVAREHELGTDVLLEFVEATLRWSDAGMRAAASGHHETEVGELERLAEEQEALRRVATLVALGSPSGALFAAVAEEVARVLHVPLAGIDRYESDGTATELASRSQHGGLFPIGTRWPLDGGDVVSGVRDTRAPVRIDDYTGVSGTVAERLREAGIGSTVATPIVVAGELWGAIMVAWREPVPLPADTESRLAAFSELVAMAISNANAREEVQRLADEQAALRRVATMVAREAPQDEVFAKVAEEVARLLGVEGAGVQRYERDGHALTVGTWGVLSPAGKRWAPDGDSLTATVYRTGRPARFSGDAVIADARRLGIHAAIALPIVVDGRLWGTIFASTTRPDPMPADAESRIEEFTTLVATAISNLQARSDLAASRARVVAASDRTRRQIERDLHDGAQQRLVQTLLNLKLARDALATHPETVPALMEEALGHAQRATVELRELVHGILPPVLTHGGLRPAVRTLARRMPVPVETDVVRDRFPAAVEATAYFVVAEALTNVAKHAGASHATVMARVRDGILEVEVRDDGVGGAHVDGTGLVGLADRLAVLDGRLRVESPAGSGTLVAAVIPIP